jgi:hypothetical protein
MRIAPEFVAVAVWSIFVTSIVVIDTAETNKVAVRNDGFKTEKLVTGRSAAMAPSNVYGALFVDPSLQQDPQIYAGPKPTSADLTAK